MTDYARRVRRIGTAARQYLTGSNLFKGKPEYLSDPDYERVLRNFVVTCVDLLVVNSDGQILIATRQQEPHPGDWVIGGRMWPGESYEQAAARHAEREMHVALSLKIFRSVGTYSYIWDTNAQGSGGCHMLGLTFATIVDAKTADSIRLNEEYAGYRWVNPRSIVDAPKGTYHPALVDMVRDFLALPSWPRS